MATRWQELLDCYMMVPSRRERERNGGGKRGNGEEASLEKVAGENGRERETKSSGEMRFMREKGERAMTWQPRSGPFK